MAKYNEILVGRFNRALQKITGIKGLVPSPQLAGEISPTMELFPVGAEHRYLESVIRYGNLQTISAVAAQNSAIQIRNPAGSNVVGVVEKLVFRGGTAAMTINLALGPQGGNFTTFAPTNRSLDNRAANQASTLFLSGGNNVTALPFTFANPGLANAAQDYDFILSTDQEITILPGDALMAFTQQVNVTLMMELIWRERFLEEGERF